MCGNLTWKLNQSGRNDYHKPTPGFKMVSKWRKLPCRLAGSRGKISVVGLGGAVIASAQSNPSDCTVKLRFYNGRKYYLPLIIIVNLYMFSEFLILVSFTKNR